ncbi:MAG TPA: DUF3784 domain-containing protein [Clostridiales bacterium]|jgi:hypothetical protein|nr:DUF3784 domain-containing protein [Clostridiales bacterium]
MIILNIALAAAGLAFLVFGYFIYFRKKYTLINGFPREGATKKQRRYAKLIGMAELISGAALLLLSVVCFAAASLIFSAVTLILSLTAVCAVLIGISLAMK